MQHFGLLGAKLGHSLSPQIHGMIFEELGIDADYKLLELPAEALKTAVPELSQSYTGVNVTIPHKIEVMPFLDSISDEAAAIGAVNTISFSNGKSCGYNTDWLGFGMMLEYYGIKAEGKKQPCLALVALRAQWCSTLQKQGKGSFAGVKKSAGNSAAGCRNLRKYQNTLFEL